MNIWLQNQEQINRSADLEEYYALVWSVNLLNLLRDEDNLVLNNKSKVDFESDYQNKLFLRDAKKTYIQTTYWITL